ncbi:hypothetical protein, variant [Aphanomyces astaci]|uniref:EF-hand domain-containing protein n=1 Tax=Aphanomyces astaci TaxID=112090 RepID=W4GBH8_APHAT|nr:hypothetical protein, variant [Aphanomyces astaci]ETV76429.1 hypothetical protein, variant [Aphanomyces astaci]|eukprot:XP_009833974.1 hypothetical protein, variant [Aphanomyces astaci]
MPPRKLVTTATAAQLDEVGDLFDELMDKDSGCVTAKEMAAILPYTAGAATADVQAMIDDMVARKSSLGKKQFVRLVSKRMYGGAWNAYMEALENAPLAHVIVSMKRRKHLVHFANFYLAKGVAGAELVVPADTDIHQNVSKPTLDIRRARQIQQCHRHHAPILPQKRPGNDAIGVEKLRPTKEQLHNQWIWSQRKASLVQACRTFKTGYQHVYAVVFNGSTRTLERHCVFLTKPYLRLFSGRYFCLAIAPDQDHQVIASSTGLLGKASLDRTQSCHGLSPDKLLAAFFLSPGRHAKPSRVATAAVPTTTSASFLVAAGLPPTAADHPLWVEPIHMFRGLRVERVSCNFGNVMYTAGGRLYAWGCAEITSPPCRPLVLDHSNSINCQDIEAAVIRRQHPCIAPTLDEVHRIDASAYSVAPREFHKAMHEYSMWLSRQRIEPHSNNNSSINHEQDPSTLACTRWQHAKVQMGPHAIAPTLTDMHSVICGGEEFYVALSKEGTVFTWGDGTFGRLGRTGQPASSTIPHQVIGFEHPIRVVACGARHVICTDGHGLVYSWGGNLHGQLGTGLTDDVYQPAVIAFLREKVVVDVVAGDDHTMALSNVGDVYTFGNNWCGQLGQGKRDTLWSPVPAPVEFPEALSDPIYMIRSIGTTCAAVSVTGTTYLYE